MKPRALLVDLPESLLVEFERLRGRADNEDECWLWQGNLFPNGYGDFLGLPAHRRAWFQETGQQPGKQNVLHECNNPACTNPQHLKLGTQAENLQQAANQGRLHRNPVLSDNQVREIRQNPDVSISRFARRFKVNPSVVWNARNRRTYKNVPDTE